MHFFILTLILMLSGCIDEAESQSTVTTASEAVVEAPAPTPAPAAVQDPLINYEAIPITKTICDNKVFPASLTVNTNGHTYESACRLKQLGGIKIAGTDTVYLCQSELFQEGFAGNGNHFLAEKVKQVLGESAEKADILSSHGFVGKRFAVVLLENTEGTQIIATKEELGKLDVTLETENAALAWAYLSGVLGRGMGSGFAPEAMCGAEINSNDSGWLLTGAEIFKNCQPKELRNLSISSDGKINILKKTVKENAPALCID